MVFDSTQSGDAIEELEPGELRGFMHDLRACERAHVCATEMLQRVCPQALVSAPTSRRKSGCACRDSVYAPVPRLRERRDYEPARLMAMARNKLARALRLDDHFRQKTSPDGEFSLRELVDDAHTFDFVGDWRTFALERRVIRVARGCGARARYVWAAGASLTNAEGGAHGRDDE